MRALLPIVLLAACAPSSLRDDRFPTGSTTLVVVDRHATAAAVNVDEGTVSFAPLGGGPVEEVEVGAEPWRLAPVGDEVWVTLRGERAIAVLAKGDDGRWRRSGRVAVGAEPTGIVASEDGRRVYVANPLSEAVTELDGQTRAPLRTFAVQDQPQFLALHPSGRALFVASRLHGTVSRVDLRSGEVSLLERPGTTRRTPDGEVELEPRNTGDLAITPDGTTLAVPTLYADTLTSVEEPEAPGAPVVDGYGGSSGTSVGRLNPALSSWSLDASGVPEGDGVAVFLAASAIGRDPAEPPGTVRSYPTSVIASPDGARWFVTMEGSDAVVVTPTETPSLRVDGEFVSGVAATAAIPVTGDGTATTSPMPFTDPAGAGFEVRPIVVVTTGVGPKSVAFDQQSDALVHAWLDRAIETLPVGAVSDRLRDLSEGAFVDNRVPTRDRRAVAAPSLPEGVEAGRRLFYSATDPRMAASGAGVSCSTCHMDGRNDGFTWTLRGEPRNTPSLAGPVQETAPVTWSEAVPTVADEAMLTSSLRMGGAGLSPAEAAQIESFLAHGRYPDVPRQGDRSAQVALGEEVFRRPEVGCATCHVGEHLTDGLRHDVFGPVPTETPTLRGIAASAPYLHDGSAKDLAAVVAWAGGGAMGDTSSLTARERAALVAYLESL
jgi:cytochrome c peroxidase/DNA-binding beta-propeller fold protein YncE